MTSEEISERLTAAISGSMKMFVVREDVLGEGEGAWDSDPRYPSDTVNCLTWLQFLLSEVYSRGPDDKTAVMDRIRYYGGHIGYGTRKHFLDHWLSIEPAPLKRIDLKNFTGFRRASIQLDFEHFRTFHNYPCRLYRQDLSVLEVDYLTSEGLLECVNTLAPGHYVAFAVAKEKYLLLFGAGSGPMGLVHSLILTIDGQQSPDVSLPQSDRARIYHASTFLGAVIEVPLQSYLAQMVDVFDGFALFELDPSWDASSPVEENDEARSILRCEAALHGNESRRNL
jgi:hypothetical protein